VREFASEPLLRRLIDWGIDTVFGRPGDGPDGIVGAFQRHQNEIRLLTVEHEEAAGLMACGWAKATGRIGVCLATSGPGAVRLLNGLYDAKLDRQPVLAITESPRTRLLGTDFDQNVCLDKVLADVADYSARVHVPVQIPAMVDIGIGNAVAMGSVSHITFPWSLEPGEAESGPWMVTTAAAPPTAPVFAAAPGVPPTADLERAAAVLNEGSRVAMLIGAGGTGATNELLAVAEVLGSPIVKSLPGKTVVPDDHPLTTGCAGTLGTRPSQQALRAADTLLVVGSNYPYLRDSADPEAVSAVHLDTDLARIDSPRPNDVALAGDAAETLRALLPLLDRRQDRGFLQLAIDGMAAWRAHLLEVEDSSGYPIRPGFLVRTVDRLAAEDAVLSSDPGPMTTWSARHFEVRGGRGYLVSASFGAMPAGLPYAIAAQASQPDRQCIALVSSEGLSKLMVELLTATRHHLPVKVLVADTSLAVNFAFWAEAHGALGLRVEAAGQLEEALALALDHDGPVLVDVLADPAEQPAPALGAGA
jgi:thiamine pyrophosphate-dependent acetolactate synthase large subunit-like protein